MGDEAESLFDRDEYLTECALREERENNINDIVKKLERMSNPELLDYLCKQGPKLNTLESFKTYTVAKRIKDNGWIPTARQRDALINTAAIALNP
jgi:hypothetical protein